MSFDLFVQSCIILKRMTDVFKKYDDDRDGYITLSFEEFLTGKSPASLAFADKEINVTFENNDKADITRHETEILRQR